MIPMIRPVLDEPESSFFVVPADVVGVVVDPPVPPPPVCPPVPPVPPFVVVLVAFVVVVVVLVVLVVVVLPGLVVVVAAVPVPGSTSTGGLGFLVWHLIVWHVVVVVVGAAVGGGDVGPGGRPNAAAGTSTPIPAATTATPRMRTGMHMRRVTGVPSPAHPSMGNVRIVTHAAARE